MRVKRHATHLASALLLALSLHAAPVMASAAVAVSMGASAASHDANGVALTKPAVVVDGNKVTFTWTVSTNKSVTFKRVQLNTINQPGPGWQPGAGFNSDVTIDGERTFRATQQLPEGGYATSVTYSLDGKNWVHSERASYQVGGNADPAPPPVQYDRNGVALTKPSVVVDGNNVKFTWNVKTNKSVRFHYLQLATAGQAGDGFNNGVSINGERSFSANQWLPTGSHSTAVVYSLDGRNWVNGERLTYSVGSGSTPPPTDPPPTDPPPGDDPPPSDDVNAPMPVPKKNGRRILDALG